jgi:hypothetical protein
MSEDTTTTTEQESAQAPMEQPVENLETQAVQVEEEVEASTESETDTIQTNSDDEELMEWAKKKGIKTEDTVSVLRMARESEKAMHNATTQARQLQNSVKTVGDEQGLDDMSLTLNRLKVTEFYLANPDAKSLDEDMAAIVTAKPFLADDLDTVYELARARRKPVSEISERQVGRQEALAQVAKAEKAAPPNASATTRESDAGYSIDKIEALSVKDYVQFRKDNPDWNPYK